MTSLVVWTGVDSRGPASLYVASDSRISWGEGGHWDFARKVFPSSCYPDILGYCGDVLFTSQVLGQIIGLLDAHFLYEADATPESRFLAISEVLKEAHSTYPEKERHPFSVIHCSRRDEGMTTLFAAFELAWRLPEGWQSTAIPVPGSSGIVATYGSGKRSVSEWVGRWDKSEVGGTSRSIFSAFCDSLKSGEDTASGGAPQLAGIYRKGPAESFGVVYQEQRYLQGLRVDPTNHLSNVEWRNDLFERCDWKTGERLPGAQRHARPRQV